MTLKIAGAAERLKSATKGVVTVRTIAAVWVSVPLVPVTVRFTVPVVAVALAANVSVLAPVVDVGLKVAVTPVGWPLTLNATAPVKPLNAFTLIVLVALAPRATLTVPGVAESAKSGVAVPVTSP